MKDPKTEQYLDRGQWAWKYLKRVDFIEIDLKKSEENPARINRRLDELRAQQYGCDMLDGVEFPAILLLNHSDPKSAYKWEVASGMHRLSGAREAGGDWFDAYVVTEADVYRREVLIRQSNAIEGRGMTVAEQTEHVLFLKRQYPDKSLVDLAKSWSLKLNALTNAYNEDKARDRALRYKIDLARLRVPQKSAVALGSIHSEPVFKAAVEFVSDIAGTTSGEIKDMATEIKKARDEKSALEIVKRFRELAEQRLKRAAAKTARTQPTIVNRLISDCKRTNRYFDRSLASLHVAALDRRARSDATEIAKDLIENLKRFLVEVDRVEKMSGPSIGMVTGLRPEMRL